VTALWSRWWRLIPLVDLQRANSQRADVELVDAQAADDRLPDG
jgi:hypothetical protein